MPYTDSLQELNMTNKVVAVTEKKEYEYLKVGWVKGLLMAGLPFILFFILPWIMKSGIFYNLGVSAYFIYGMIMAYPYIGFILGVSFFYILITMLQIVFHGITHWDQYSYEDKYWSDCFKMSWHKITLIIIIYFLSCVFFIVEGYTGFLYEYDVVYYLYSTIELFVGFPFGLVLIYIILSVVQLIIKAIRGGKH